MEWITKRQVWICVGNIRVVFLKLDLESVVVIAGSIVSIYGKCDQRYSIDEFRIHFISRDFCSVRTGVIEWEL